VVDADGGTDLWAFLETTLTPRDEAGRALVDTSRHGGRLTIGACPYNSGWIRWCFGLGTFTRMKSLPISCSSSVVATPTGLVRYADDVTRAMERWSGEKCRGHDQRFHNFVLQHPRPRPRTRFFEAGEGPVFTVGYVSPVERAFHGGRGPEGRPADARPADARPADARPADARPSGEPGGALRRVRNRDGSVTPLVHQYDRHPALRALFDEMERRQGWLD
jgi:hypothetical protein